MRTVSSFFTATAFQELENTLPKRIEQTRSAKDTREFLSNIFSNFKAFGFDTQQMIEAKSEAVKIITLGRARIAYSSVTDDPKAAELQQDFIALANELLSDQEVKGLYERQHASSH